MYSSNVSNKNENLTKLRKINLKSECTVIVRICETASSPFICTSVLGFSFMLEGDETKLELISYGLGMGGREQTYSDQSNDPSSVGLSSSLNLKQFK